MIRKVSRQQQSPRRKLASERLEPRKLLAADPIHVGVVYLETDYLETDQDVGGDSRGDRFILSFTGGAPNTELTEIRIDTDKDGDGISIGDPIYDTAVGGRGKDGAADFQIVRVQTTDGRAVDVTAEVDDGGQELVLRLSNFRAGDRLEFTLDVDEVLRNAIDLAVFNDRLDVITSGQEFQDSILDATFEAPHYETAVADAIFINDYGTPDQDHGLNLPPDEGDDIDSRPDRSAAAIAETQQVPKPISISGHVWLDHDLDLVRESNEQILSNIEVSLWQRNETNGLYEDTGLRTRTDSNGRYEFSKSLSLTPGTYQVVQTQPAGVFSVGSVPGTVDGANSGDSLSVNLISNIEIPLGDLSAINYDFAEARPASVSGFVYADNSNDGIRDPSEQGIAGVTVRLVPVNTIAPQQTLNVTTNADGSYEFTGLVPGEYEIIEVTQPDGYTDGLDTAGTIDGRTVGIADNPGDQIRRVFLNGGDDGIEYNFGELANGSLSGFVYLAGPGQDCTSIHDAPGNSPLAGVVVELQRDDGTTITQVTTDATGRYEFDDIPLGNYRIVQYTPDGLLDGDSYAGKIGGVSVGDAVNGSLIQSISLNPGQVGTEFNFCEGAPATISGFVYEDDSNDGSRDPNEQGIEGVVITLVDSNGRIVAQTTTDSRGRYEFEGIPPGDYGIIETHPTDYFDGIDTPGTIGDRIVGQPGADGDSIRNVMIKQGQTGTEFNFGELRPASLSGRVHVDTDGDCIADPDEERLAGVVIRLLDEFGNEVATTQTDSNGQYTFDNIEPGDYTLVEEQPAGLFDGDASPGSAGGNVENANRIGNITLAPGEVAVDYDFCENPPSEIIGSVFSDLDGDCVFDSNEVGIDGVQVDLYDNAGTLVASTNTDAFGNYRFTNLPAGSYTIRETQPDGFLQGGQVAGSNGGDDSQADVISRVPVGWGERLTNYNFCEIEPASVSGFVFVDGNGDCVRQDDEPPLAGVTIELRDASGTRVATTTTDANGQYTFDGLRPGQYSVFEQQPDGYFQGGETLGSGGGEILGDDHLGFSIAAGNQLVNYSFCEIAPSSISGFVTIDNDGDCIRDADDEPLAGVLIELQDASGNRIAQTTTDANGQYSFENLAPGQYRVFEFQPDGLLQGGQVVGSGGGSVLGQDLMSFGIAGGQALVNYDFCEIEPATISGFVHIDNDGDCVRDADDEPLAGVLVELQDANGNRISRTTTDANGQYRFENLAPGEYRIFEVQPDGLLQGGQVLGNAGGSVLGQDLLAVQVSGGQTLVNYNFCEIEPATISGFVTIDNDGDCVRDEDDEGLAGVVVELQDAAGNRIARTTTDSQGQYSFAGLAPGQYRVFELQPEGLFHGGQTLGSHGGSVLGPDLLLLDVGGGQQLTNYNFCELEPASIGGSVWEEVDLNREFNPGDIPIPGVLVELIDTSGDVIDTARTGTDGSYLFDGLVPGVYSVRETQPNHLFHGGQVVGTAGGEVGADDLLVSIDLKGGVHGRDYDFPEVPPATISGYVFQDGEALRLAQEPPPEELREYRDGLKTADDEPINGVTLQLRNLLGLPVDSSRALPGAYRGDSIEVTTDETGYYEFTGLRPGTYHVYEIQPEDFSDSLDTAGTTGGLPVNPADAVDDDDRIVIQTLTASEATNPRDDAILNVFLRAGDHSQQNNFSEIVIQDPTTSDFLRDPDVEDPLVAVPVETFDPRIRLVTFADPEGPRAPLTAYDEWAVSWHLSVINGGFPRGSESIDGVISRVSAKMMRQNWEQGDHVSGRWSLMTQDGERLEDSDDMTLGEENGTALAGDFDGDGTDEVAIYAAGQWFVDLNGNGVWDAGDLWIQLGTELDRPVVGDWDGDGKDDIAIFGRQWLRDPQRIKRDPGLPDPDNKRRRNIDNRKLVATEEERGEDRERLLRLGNRGELRADAVDHVFQYGEQVDTPLSGDWNGDGIDQIAVFRGGVFMLDSDGDGRWTKGDEKVFLGQPGDEPIVGDFNGDGIDEIGVIRGDVWIIDTDGNGKITGNDLQMQIPRESGESQPIVGDWDGDGKDDPGYYNEAA